MLKTFFSQLTDLFARGGAGLFVLALCCALFFVLGTLFARVVFAASLSKKIAVERADAVKKSRAVLGGLAGEQVAPFMPGFPCNPADARFVGKPVDFVAFPGAADGDEIKEVLGDVKFFNGAESLAKHLKEVLEEKEVLESEKLGELDAVPEKIGVSEEAEYYIEDYKNFIKRKNIIILFIIITL